MKVLLQTLVIVLLVGLQRTSGSGFSYSLESRSVATNRSKVGIKEYIPSCGPGPTLYAVYRDQRRQEWTTIVSEGTTYNYYYRCDTADYGTPSETMDEFVHAESSGAGGSCSYTLEDGNESGSYSCTTPPPYPSGWFVSQICPVDGPGTTSSTTTAVTNYCYCSNGCSYVYSYQHGASTTLLNEYATSELLNAEGLAYPDDWHSGAASAAGTFSDLLFPGGSPETVHVRDFGASFNKAQYRFKVLAPKGERFKIDYNLWLQYEGEPPTNTLMSISGVGTGDWAYYPDEPLELLPPYKVKTTDGCPDYVGGSRSIELLCGDLLGQGCQGSCQPGPGSINPGLTDSGLAVSMNLGSAGYGEESAAILLGASHPSNSVATPAGLSLVGSIRSLEVISPSGTPRQVKSPQVLADVITLNSASYEVRFYADAGAIGGGGLYEPAGFPFATAKVEQITDPNHIRLTVSSGSIRVFDYQWSAADGGWQLTSGGGLRKETTGWNEPTLMRSNTVRNAANDLVFQQTKQYVELAGFGRVIAKQTTGTGNSALTNLWFYYDNPATDGTNYGRVKLTIDPNGFWKRFAYDHAGRVTNEVSQFRNAATNEVEGLCRVARYDYATLDGTNNCETRVELLQGVEIAREYTVMYPGVTHHIRCSAPGATWTNANNLVTITYYQASPELVGKPQRVIAPDGTLQVYQYSTDGTYRTEVVLSGQPDSGFADVVNGTKTVVVTSGGGQIQTRESFAIQNGVAYRTASEAIQYDPQGRPTTTSYLDGTTTVQNYDCCGLDNTVDREGVTTTYLYDGLRRQVGTLRNNISLTNLIDAAGNALRTVRVGQDGVTNLMRSACYDNAGRLRYETNALSGVTAHAYSQDASGQSVKTIIYPDNGERIETYYQDGALRSISGSAAFPTYYDYGAYDNGTFVMETKATPDRIYLSPEWTKTYTDMLGRSWKTEYPGGAASTNFYNPKGQLEKAVDPDGVTRLYTYNGLGQTDKTILDLNRNGVGTDSVDRITRTTNDVVEYSGFAAPRTRVFQTADNGSEILESERLTVPAQNTSITLNFGLGTTNVTSYGYLQRTITTTQPDSSFVVTLYTNGVRANVTRYAPGWWPVLSQADYAYDAHGRLHQVIDARNGATTYTYNAADQVQTVTTPSPDGLAAGLVTTTYYDKSLRATNVIQPDLTTNHSVYFANGLLQKTWGSRLYPVEYQYDQAGRMTNMLTWQNFNETTGTGTAGSAATKWLYDTSRGWLNQKKYADNTGPSYTYTPAGRLKSRAWARTVGGQPLATWYTNNNAGELWVVNYTDTTPDVTNTYDRRGRLTNTLSGATSLTKVYSDAGNLLRETYSGGPLNGLSLTNGYDEFLRRTNLSLLAPSSKLLSATKYAYDPASRLLTVSDGTNSATYDYLDYSPLVEQIVFATNGTTVMTTTKGYDFVNRLTNTVSANSQLLSPISYAYAYNSANQRTSVTNGDGSYWVYSFDSMGQVTSDKKYWSDHTPVAGQQFDYAFDDIGNRQTTTRDTRQALYTPNNLNQYTQRTVPGYVNVLGTATNTATVSLWSKEMSALYASTARKGDYFRGEIPVNNATGAVWLTVTNVAVLSNYAGADVVTNTVGRLFVPKTTETFSHDADGNLTNDGRWAYNWDAENRTTSFTRNGSAPAGAKVKLDCQYDSQWRRTQKIVSTWNGSTYVSQSTNKFVYDGWNLIAILDATNGLVQSFTWGTDASGTMQGAGGVGGLISMTVHSGTNAGTYCYCYDGNHNVTTLVNAISGAVGAQYEYDAFLGILRATGPLAFTNPFAGSTKFCDWETGLLYYSYRYYDPDTGRWPNRDPIAEKGGRNLYGFAANDGVNHYDKLGKQFCGYNCMPKDCNGVPDGPIRQTGCDVFIELLRRWRSGSGWSYEIPSDVMDSMMSSGQNAKDIEQMKEMLKQRCRKFRPRGMAMEQIAYESFTSAGAECEAWFLGGHTRTISGIADCCSNRAQVCLEVTDKWDFDEQDPYPKGGAGDWAKYLSSICIGAVLDLGTLDWPVPVPVHGKKCIEVKL